MLWKLYPQLFLYSEILESNKNQPGSLRLETRWFYAVRRVSLLVDQKLEPLICITSRKHLSTYLNFHKLPVIFLRIFSFSGDVTPTTQTFDLRAVLRQIISVSSVTTLAVFHPCQAVCNISEYKIEAKFCVTNIWSFCPHLRSDNELLLTKRLTLCIRFGNVLTFLSIISIVSKKGVIKITRI